MNILIPAAGRGQRFADAGYALPKPFIKIAESTMLARVIWNAGGSVNNNSIYVILQEEHRKLWKEPFGISPYTPIYINGITEGAACTVLKARGYINNDAELVLANSDQLIEDRNWFSMAINHFQNKGADCGVVCFLNDNPKWSYARVTNGRILEIAEKNPISQIATCGIYYFKRGQDFVWAAEQMIEKNIRTNNEFYVAPAINQLIERGCTVVPYMINQMVGLGTPEDLSAYLKECYDIH